MIKKRWKFTNNGVTTIRVQEIKLKNIFVSFGDFQAHFLPEYSLATFKTKKYYLKISLLGWGREEDMIQSQHHFCVLILGQPPLLPGYIC